MSPAAGQLLVGPLFSLARCSPGRSRPTWGLVLSLAGLYARRRRPLIGPSFRPAGCTPERGNPTWGSVLSLVEPLLITGYIRIWRAAGQRANTSQCAELCKIFGVPLYAEIHQFGIIDRNLAFRQKFPEFVNMSNLHRPDMINF